MNYTRKDFGEDFQWGVSTAAYQIEGGYNSHGKGPSIWDAFVKKRSRITGGQHGNIACDFYNRFESDLDIIQQLHIPNHRFSISWSRILPAGTGAVNMQGIDFYNRLVNQSLEKGIEPWVTLYHWDLPLPLQLLGGWTNREIVQWFTYYVYQCSKYFGDRVKNWIILNEPMVFTGAGYFLGVHAPGKKGLKNFLSAVHHAALCQAEGGRTMRKLQPVANIGTTFSCSHVQPFRQIPKDIIAAKKADVLLNRLFIEPLLGLGYPTDELRLLKRIEAFVKPGDYEKLAFDMDFIGVQNYTREVVMHHSFTPFIQARIIKASKRKVFRTEMDWEVYPESIYHMLKKFGGYKNIPSLVVTENGAAFPDRLTDGNVKDVLRINFLKDYIGQVLRAKNEGVPVTGYFVWTLLDNFEWAEGYQPKFGLVHVDFETLKRTIKDSGFWYRNFLSDET